MRITAVLIVKNEASNLIPCLESVRGVVDEIVVTDTGSTDGTQDLARSFTPLVSEFEWIDDFAAARNFALQHATGDYILHIDADDVLCAPERARAQLEAFARTNDPEVVGTIAIESAIGEGADASHAVEIALRFFRRGYFRYEGAIHEQLVPLAGAKRAASTGLRYVHSGYCYDSSSAHHKARRNKAILLRVLERAPGDEYYLYQLGKAHFGLKEFADAAQRFEEALSYIRFDGRSHPKGNSGVLVAEPVLSELLCSLAYSYANVGAPERAQALLERHRELGHGGTHSADFHHALGYIYLVQGAVAPAKAAYAESLRIGPAGERVLGVGSYSSEYHLGLLAEAERDLNGAVDHYRRSLAIKPDYAVTLSRCVDLIREYHIVLPASVWDITDHEALLRIYRDRLFAVLRQDGAAGASELISAARALSPELVKACGEWLREFLAAQSSQDGA